MHRFLLPWWLCAALPLPAQEQPLPVLLVSGQNNHDWRWSTPELKAALEETQRFTVTVTDAPARDLANAAILSGVRAIVLNYNGDRWGEAAERAFLAAVTAGTGVVVIHAANNAFPGWTEYERLVGLCWREGTGHGNFHPYDVVVVDRHHPVTNGMEDMRLHPDELYHRLVHMHGAEFRVLLSSFSDPKQGGTGRHEPMATVASYGKGRVFHTPLGHTWTDQVPTRASILDPQFRRLLARGTEWAASGAVTLDPAPPNWLTVEERAQGFAQLFDGRKLEQWRAFKQKAPPVTGWSVSGASLVHAAGAGGGDLVSAERYGDFDFRFDWRIARGGNSGVMFWVQEDAEQTYMSGPEYQLLDDGTGADPKHSAGALYDLVAAAADKPVRKPGEWNQSRIVISKGRLQQWLNGKLVVDTRLDDDAWQALVTGSKFKDWPFAKVREGHLALQDHGDEVAFRNLRIKRL